MSTLRYMAAVFGPSVFWITCYGAYTVIAGMQP